MQHKIGFGGGCHWCTEAVFQSLMGVSKVEQGWIGSAIPHEALSEAVVIHYDPETIPMEVLVEIHLLTHSSTAVHPLRYKYRSAIYYLDERTKKESTMVLKQLTSQNNQKYITEVLPMVTFRLNEEQYLDYYKKQPEAPFCRNFILPKLELLRKQYGERVQ